MKTKGKADHQREDMVGIVCVMLAIMMLVMIPIARAELPRDTVSVFPPNSKPYGITYADWTAKWWQWLYSIPKDRNAIADLTGKNCGEGQSGPVWYLGGTLGGSTVRSCTIPAGKAILISVLGNECSTAENPTLKTLSDLRTCAMSADDKVSSLGATVDGVKLQNLSQYRLQTSIFNLTFPNNNVVGVPAGSAQGVGDGFWVFLAPLSPGKHDVGFNGATVDYTSTGVNSYANAATYHLTIR